MYAKTYRTRGIICQSIDAGRVTCRYYLERSLDCHELVQAPLESVELIVVSTVHART
jgi:hypothetical protein